MSPERSDPAAHETQVGVRLSANFVKVTITADAASATATYACDPQNCFASQGGIGLF